MARSPPDLDLPQISHQSLCLAAEIACLAPEITGLMLSPPVTPDRNSTGTPPLLQRLLSSDPAARPDAPHCNSQ